MADTKITSLQTPQVTTNPATDVLPIVNIADNSMATSGSTRKITVNQLLGAGGTATLASTTITGALTVGASANFNGGALAAYLNGNLMFGSSGNTLNLFAQSSGFALKENTGAYNLFTAATGGFVFGDGAGGTRMTLNSTGLGIGGTPVNKMTVTVAPGTSTSDGVRVTDSTRTIGIFQTGSTYSYLGIGANQNLIYSAGNRLDVVADGQSLFLRTGTSNYLNLDSSGNVGIGVTPSAWQAGQTALQVKTGAIWTGGVSVVSYSNNVFYDGSRKYISTAAATEYQQTGSQHIWFTAPSGTAGNAITFTQAMTLDASGNLLVGTTSSLGSSSNSTRTVGGVFVTAGGSTASTASGSAVTLFTAPNEAVFMVSAYIFGTGSPSAYNAVAIVKVSGGSATITTISSATGISVSLSGLNVQATQTSGSSQVIAYSAIRIS